MKIISILLLVFVSINGISYASTDKYRVNDEQIEALINSSSEFDKSALGFEDASCVQKDASFMAGDNQYIAGGIALAQVFLAWGIGIATLGIGILFCAVPIHRIYLGTNAGVVIGYVLTCGGCGWITLIDGIVLMASSNPGKYGGSHKWFMW